MSRGYKNHILSAICAFALSSAYISANAQTTRDELDSLVNSFNTRVSEDIIAFEQYADSVKDAYNAYVEKATAEFNVYKDNIRQVWGGDSAVVDSRYEWVEYGDDFHSRSVVNFEKGNARVEVAVDPDADPE